MSLNNFSFCSLGLFFVNSFSIKGRISLSVSDLHESSKRVEKYLPQIDVLFTSSFSLFLKKSTLELRRENK